MFTPFFDRDGEPLLQGFLHSPPEAGEGCVVLTHGAGANCQSKLLIQLSDALAASGFTVLRFDLPFRLARPHGPPSFGSAAKDQAGLCRAASVMRARTKGKVFLGGHSYGGRQATMLVAAEPQVAEGLLLLSYPLHPPQKPQELRTQHFPDLKRPAFFVHGSRDPFGTIEQMDRALKLLPAPHFLFEVEGAGHDLLSRNSSSKSLTEIAGRFRQFQKATSLEA